MFELKSIAFFTVDIMLQFKTELVVLFVSRLKNEHLKNFRRNQMKLFIIIYENHPHRFFLDIEKSHLKNSKLACFHLKFKKSRQKFKF
jgi:tRNA G10  N-methylase Trm11